MQTNSTTASAFQKSAHSQTTWKARNALTARRAHISEPARSNVISISTRPPRLLPESGGLYAEVDDLLRHPVFLETRFEIHHNIRKCDHLLRTARFAWAIAGIAKANRRTCARAALLHDVHSRLGTWSTHGAIAASVAEDVGETKAVCDAIVPHMFPIGPAPKTREAWVLTLADKAATIADTLYFAFHALSGASLKERKLLRASDRFIRRRPARDVQRAA